MAKKNPTTGIGGKHGNINKGGWIEKNVHPRWGGGSIEETLEERCEMDPLPNTILLINDIKTNYNAHISEAGNVHDVDLSGSVVATDDATDEPTVYTLANAIKAAFDLHLALGNAAGHADGADVTNPTTEADATTFATMIALVEELRAHYEAHRVLDSSHGTPSALNTVDVADYAGCTCTTAIFPAGSIGKACCTYVHKGMATAVNFDVGVVGTLTRFAENELDTDDKADQNLSVDEYDSATAVVLTPDVTPTSRDGVILVQIHFERFQALTSGQA